MSNNISGGSCIFCRFLNCLSPVRERISEPEKHEIIPGVTEPSIILADMLVAKMLQDPFRVETYRFSTGKFLLTWEASCEGDQENFVIRATGALPIKLVGEAERRLESAVFKVRDIVRKKKDADAYAKYQRRAVDVIEALLIGEPA